MFNKSHFIFELVQQKVFGDEHQEAKVKKESRSKKRKLERDFSKLSLDKANPKRVRLDRKRKKTKKGRISQTPKASACEEIPDMSGWDTDIIVSSDSDNLPDHLDPLFPPLTRQNGMMRPRIQGHKENPQ